MKARAKPAKAAKPLWVCSRCRRSFASRNQWHSCNVQTLDTHFAGRPAALRALFNQLRNHVRGCGPSSVNPVKSAIIFQVRKGFMGVKVLRDKLRVGFLLTRRIEHPRLFDIEVLSARKVAHHVWLASAADLDAEFLAWVREARAAGEQGPLKGRDKP